MNLILAPTTKAMKYSTSLWTLSRLVYKKLKANKNLERYLQAGEIFPSWRDISKLERYFQAGEIFPSWRDISKLERYFQAGEIFPSWRDISKLERYFQAKEVSPSWIEISRLYLIHILDFWCTQQLVVCFDQHKNDWSQFRYSTWRRGSFCRIAASFVCRLMQKRP